ncbi:MAG: hypothetical protein V8Q84_11905 [Bilophila sp.]
MPDSIAGVATTSIRQVLRQAMHYSIACTVTTTWGDGLRVDDDYSIPGVATISRQRRSGAEETDFIACAGLPHA